MDEEILNPEKILECKQFAYRKLLEGPKSEIDLRRAYFNETSDAAIYAPIETISKCFNLAFAVCLLIDSGQVSEKDGIFYAIS
jgi:hypothetical protein